MSPENESTQPTAPRRSRGGYPLSALFILMTSIAVLAGMLSSLARAEVRGDWIGGGMVGCGIVGLIAGAVAGTFRRPSWVFAPLGAASGLGLGLFVGPLAGASIVALPSILAACVGGAVAIVIIGVLMRLAERRRELPSLSPDAEAHEMGRKLQA